MMRAIVVVAAGLVLGLACGARALPPGSPAAEQALDLCQRSERSPEERDVLLARGLALAEAAVRADAGDARAHFAVFCNLGRRVQADGLGILHLLDVVRVLRELDVALMLAPDDPDVAAAKGAVLANLPRFLGGDAAAGEQWLRHALALDPQHAAARSYLAAALVRRDADAEAR